MKQLSTMTSPRNNALGVYISIPFCRSKCTYCNFASGVYPAREHGRYVDRLIEDMTDAGRWASQMGPGRSNLDLPRRVDTVYLGGGTPSLLEPDLVKRLFGTLRAEFDIENTAEITVECAPGQLADGTLEAMAGAGVNRVSLGVQSFIDREARETGRLHSRIVVIEDMRRLRAAGIGNLNVDLIAGLPGQTLASWEESLAVLIDSGVPHASVYMLEVDEDSRLGREMLNGGARYHAGLVPSDDAIVRMYERAIEKLGAECLVQYEISNFARKGCESRHNLRYWERRPYLGLGLDASSMLREALQTDGSPASYAFRLTITDDLSAYLAGGDAPETAWLSPDRQHEEAWFLGLRRNVGVEIAALEAEFGRERVRPALEVVSRLENDGLVILDSGRVRLTGSGRVLSNEVFQQFLGLEAGVG